MSCGRTYSYQFCEIHFSLLSSMWYVTWLDRHENTAVIWMELPLKSCRVIITLKCCFSSCVMPDGWQPRLKYLWHSSWWAVAWHQSKARNCTVKLHIQSIQFSWLISASHVFSNVLHTFFHIGYRHGETNILYHMWAWIFIVAN